ncbi:MAG: hypothetical protein OXI10_15055, partial [Gammaproteobacteria bacterium]|nr:hypothetical protein [Gammaproteobacteria bacterium]
VDVNDMLQADETRLRMLIENHGRYTNSRMAREILDNWQDTLGKFVKVMPHEYERALVSLREEAMPALEVSHG